MPAGVSANREIKGEPQRRRWPYRMPPELRRLHQPSVGTPTPAHESGHHGGPGDRVRAAALAALRQSPLSSGDCRFAHARVRPRPPRYWLCPSCRACHSSPLSSGVCRRIANLPSQTSIVRSAPQPREPDPNHGRPGDFKEFMVSTLHRPNGLSPHGHAGALRHYTSHRTLRSTPGSMASSGDYLR